MFSDVSLSYSRRINFYTGVKRDIWSKCEGTRGRISSIGHRLSKLEEEIKALNRVAIRNNIIIVGLSVDENDLLNYDVQ